MAAGTGNKLIKQAEDKLKEANGYVETCENAPKGTPEYSDLANAKATAAVAKKKFDSLWKSYGGYR